MKLEGGLVFVFLILVGVIFVSFASASIDSAVTNTANQIDQGVQDVEQTVQGTEAFLTKEEVREEYLKREWTKLLESKPVFKQIIEGYRKVSPYSDPIIEFLIGMMPQFSLLFILVVFIWFTLLKYYYTSWEAVMDLALFSRASGAAIYTSIFVILIVLQIFQNISVFLANKIVALIELVSNPWIQLLLWLVAAVVFISLSKFSRVIVVSLKLYRRKRRLKNLNKRQEEAVKKVEKVAATVSGSS